MDCPLVIDPTGVYFRYVRFDNLILQVHPHKMQERNVILEFPFSMPLKISMTTSPYLWINVRDSKF